MPTSILALAGLASLVVGWLTSIILPAEQLFTWALLTLGGIGLGGALIVDFRRLKAALHERRGRYGISASVRVSLFLGIVFLVNAISTHVYHRFDATSLSQFTLTSQTRKVLSDLDKRVEAVAFFGGGATSPLRSLARQLLAEYQLHSGMLTVRSVDPDISPDVARRYGVERVGALVGAVVFTGESGRRLVYGPQLLEGAEHAFTAALLEVTGTRQRTVYFTTGHREGAIRAEFSHAAAGLRDNLFRVAELDLLKAGRVPEDAAVVVLGGPRTPLAREEAAMLGAYLVGGGRLLALVDPNPTAEVRQLLATWWLDIGDGHIVDPASHVVPNLDNVLVPRTRNSYGLSEVYFPGATALIPRGEVPPTTEVSALVWTSPEGWLDSEDAADARASFDPAAERKGPLAIGALVNTVTAGSAAVKGARLAAIGDSDFATDRHFLNGGNGELFLKTVGWLAAGQDVIAMERKVLAVRRLLLSPEEARFLHISSIGLLPSLLLIAAAVVWWRRRVS